MSLLSMGRSTSETLYDMTAYPILLLARHNPIKYLLERPALAGRCAKWHVLLS